MGFWDMKRRRGCMCCKQRYHKRPDPEDIVVASDDGETVNDEVYEAMRFFMSTSILPRTTSNKLEPYVAEKVAEFAKAKARSVSKRQDRTERRARKHQLAPFEREEIETGRLLGVGGFAYVFEIRSFDTNRPPSCMRTTPTSSQSTENIKGMYDEDRVKARQLLSHDAMWSQEGSSSKSSTSTKSQEHVEIENGGVPPVARYALKHLRPCLVTHPKLFAEAAMNLVSEAQILMCLDHPNIVKLHGCSVYGPSAYKEGRHNSYFVIVDRLLETLDTRISKWRKQWKFEHSYYNMAQSILLPGSRGKRLQDVAMKNKANFGVNPSLLMKERAKVAYDMCCALEYLHEKRIVHRDLKTSNIGFDIHGDVKLFDFGVSRFLPEASESGSDDLYNMSMVGTRKYAAPEVFARQPYNQKADIYSIGICLWEMFMMSTPKRTKTKTKPSTYMPLIPCLCWPQVLQELVRSTTATSPKDRPSAAHVCTTLETFLMGLSDSHDNDDLMTVASASENTPWHM